MESELHGRWYAVRCVLRVPKGSDTYEERITLWQAETIDHAIELADREAGEYAAGVDADHLGLMQAFQLFDEICSGAEVFSLMRESDLDPESYIARYFASGTELQREA
ncbi:DUF4288 domain-containing protein [Conexibacter sp. W3-3-2]|uniref:DUF4288 domain-containing protein n=1 Tax=Conexibacter sp. W3-3-2 TaxID=2675227 RepID=UPI001E36617B|nr:DUF4288 domain-containing protein [Conexibacter sp. W3-3-2]